MANNKLTDVREHNLKIWPEYFAPIVAGQKRAELRINDRGYQVGDTLNLCEWRETDEEFTGEFVCVVITHVAELLVVAGYVLLSFELQERRKADSEPVEWQFKSASGDWISVGKFGKEEAVREGCEVRALYAAPQPLTDVEREELETYRRIARERKNGFFCGMMRDPARGDIRPVPEESQQKFNDNPHEE